MRRARARGRAGGRAAAAPRAAGRRGRAGGWPGWTSYERGELADGLVLGRLEQRPAGALDPAARAGCGSGRGRSIRRGGPGRSARGARRTTWKGSKQISASGTAARIARWYSPLMSIETARIESLAVAELVEEGLQGGAVAARRAPHDRAAAVVGDRGQVAVMAAIADLVDADADQARRGGARRGGRRRRARRSARPCPSRSAAAR